MKKMPASSQKWLKGIHLVVAGLWLSCVIMLLALPLAARKVTGGDELYMYSHLYHFIDMYVLTPAAIATLLTGLVFSLFTKWGFFRHGWLVYKWIATLAIILAGIFYLGPMVTKLLGIAEAKRAAVLTDQYYIHGSTVGLWAATINTVLLVVAVFFSVFKPWKNIRRNNR